MATEFDLMVEFLDSAYVVKDQIVPCLIGPVGIGKTAAVNQHAKNVGAKKVVEIIASQILPNEVSGMTMPNAESKAMEIYDHFRLSTLEDGDILFFDELLEADQMVLSACLTLIESRTLLSGKKLPDIQIVAATNPTIQPRMLKPSIRQRFLFKEFNIDKIACFNYILEDCGLRLHNSGISLQTDSHSYNILSQRSLSKMARWVMSVNDDEELSRVKYLINAIWGNNLGTILVKAKMENPNVVENKVKQKLIDMMLSELTSDERISVCDSVNPEDFVTSNSMETIYQILQDSECWSKLEEKLMSIDMNELKTEWVYNE